MKKVLILCVCVCVGTLNVSAQVIKKDTVLIGDSTSYPKLYDSVKNYCFCNYKGKKVRTAKKDSGKRVFIIYNTNSVGEHKVSKIYYR